MDQAGILILAAAPGSGFEGALAFGPWGNGTVLQHLVAVAREAGPAVVVVVVGPRSEELIEMGGLGEAVIVINDDYGEGSASSLRAGLDTLWRIDGVETAVLIDVDRPGLTAADFVAVVGGDRDATRPVTVPKYRYARGQPIAVDRSLWPRLMGLEGDVDLLDLTAAHPDWVTELRLESSPPARVLTPTDLLAAEQRRRLT